MSVAPLPPAPGTPSADAGLPPGAREPWHPAAAASSAAFLARLPLLTSLHIHRWQSEAAALVPGLLRYGPASGGRLTRLSLTHGSLTADSAAAIRTSCPQLEELRLGTSPAGQEGYEVHLKGDFFHSLDQPTFTKLSVGSDVCVYNGVMASLVDLPHLHSLTFDAHVSNASLRSLSHLVSLERLTITILKKDGCRDHMGRPLGVPFTDLAWLFALTRLTHLHVADLATTSATWPWGWEVPRDDDASSALAVVAATLAGMTRLRSLTLGRGTFTVYDTVFAALAQLSLLTHLNVASICLRRPPPPGAHLPLLRHLSLSSTTGTPLHALRALEALLPLPCLERLTLGHCAVSAGGEGQPWHAGHTQAPAWQRLAQLLASLPRLTALETSDQQSRQQELVLHGHWTRDAGSSKPDCISLHYTPRALPLRDIAAGLQLVPAALFTALTLSDMPLGEEAEDAWGALGGALPHLRLLRLRECQLTACALAAVAQHLTAMRTLHVSRCWVVGPAKHERPVSVEHRPALSGGCARLGGARRFPIKIFDLHPTFLLRGLDRREWLALAAVRVAPLTVVMCPTCAKDFTAEVEGECGSRQQGRPSCIVWERGEAVLDNMQQA